jgi:hypothetical protein
MPMPGRIQLRYSANKTYNTSVNSQLGPDSLSIWQHQPAQAVKFDTVDTFG